MTLPWWVMEIIINPLLKGFGLERRQRTAADDKKEAQIRKWAKDDGNE